MDHVSNKATYFLEEFDGTKLTLHFTKNRFKGFYTRAPPLQVNGSSQGTTTKERREDDDLQGEKSRNPVPEGCDTAVVVPFRHHQDAMETVEISEFQTQRKRCDAFLAIRNELVGMRGRVAELSHELYEAILKDGAWKTTGRSKEEVELDWVKIRVLADRHKDSKRERDVAMEAILKKLGPKYKEVLKPFTKGASELLRALLNKHPVPIVLDRINAAIYKRLTGSNARYLATADPIITHGDLSNAKTCANLPTISPHDLENIGLRVNSLRLLEAIRGRIPGTIPPQGDQAKLSNHPSSSSSSDPSSFQRRPLRDIIAPAPSKDKSRDDMEGRPITPNSRRDFEISDITPPPKSPKKGRPTAPDPPKDTEIADPPSSSLKRAIIGKRSIE
ncbi:hypothetical protein MMC22_008566 [Lobaria immixta]|nr:hypothetical protein [Lobaria immixta]